MIWAFENGRLLTKMSNISGSLYFSSRLPQSYTKTRWDEIKSRTNLSTDPHFHHQLMKCSIRRRKNLELLRTQTKTSSKATIGLKPRGWVQKIRTKKYSVWLTDQQIPKTSWQTKQELMNKLIWILLVDKLRLGICISKQQRIKLKVP